ncbi:MAG: calcium-binding protein [Polymorphobacter sp.]
MLINDFGQITAVIADNGVIVDGAPALITAVVLNFTANGGDQYPIKANGENFRFLLNDGTVSAPVDEALNFTAPTVVPVNAIGEQQAFAEYFQERYATPETAYDTADTTQAFDLRIQNQLARTDTVLNADYFLVGTSGNNRVVGNDDDNILNGLGGDDILDGGAGNDVLNGGEGSDTASYGSATSGVTVNLGITARGNTIGAGVDSFSSIENLFGSAFDDLLTGDGASNRVDGGAGNDVLLGARGNDTLFGGAGNDLLQGGVGADIFAFDSVSNGSFDIVTDFSVSQGDSLTFGPGVTVTGVSVSFVSTGDSLNGFATENGARSLDLVLTLSSGAATQTVFLLDAYGAATNAFWENALAIDLTYPRPLPTGTELVPIA